ncbi:MAG TPA: hypothetical protein VN175_01245 [Rhizomicrobium sp.]|nr:hypothetical protein [Rhizomicrobium sp.]
MADEKHLKWLIEARAENQRSALELLELCRTHEKKLKDHKLFPDYDASVVAQVLISIAFSLWRAAFLADIDRSKGVDHAISFLDKLLVDNAINYTQDRGARAWTWAYYMTNAAAHLFDLKDTWPDFDVRDDASLDPCARWDLHQKQFSLAVARFRSDLTRSKKKSSGR